MVPAIRSSGSIPALARWQGKGPTIGSDDEPTEKGHVAVPRAYFGWPLLMDCASFHVRSPISASCWPGYGGNVEETLAAEPMTDLAKHASLSI